MVGAAQIGAVRLNATFGAAGMPGAARGGIHQSLRPTANTSYQHGSAAEVSWQLARMVSPLLSIMLPAGTHDLPWPLSIMLPRRPLKSTLAIGAAGTASPSQILQGGVHCGSSPNVLQLHGGSMRAFAA